MFYTLFYYFQMGGKQCKRIPKNNLIFAELEWINKIFPKKDSVHWHLRTTTRNYLKNLKQAGEVCTQLFQCTFYFLFYMPLFSAFNPCHFFRAKRSPPPQDRRCPYAYEDKRKGQKIKKLLYTRNLRLIIFGFSLFFADYCTIYIWSYISEKVM